MRISRSIFSSSEYMLFFISEGVFMIEAAAAVIAAFAVTNIDDIVMLAILYAQAGINGGIKLILQSSAGSLLLTYC
jgi:hypothetical protein